MSRWLLGLLAVGWAACGPGASPDPAALVGQVQAAHGSAVLRQATLSFVFRGTPYELRREGGRFAYARTTTDTLGRVVVDVLTPAGLARTVAGQPVPLDSATARAVETTVNSVAYFALLPLPLTDPAVRLAALGPERVRGEPYERVEVTFRPEGGGRDFQDRYVYWFHRDRHTLDYLAYTYDLGSATGPDATGTRFRVAFNARTVGGARLQDYHNHTADGLADLATYAARYAAHQTRPVSDVVLDSVRVVPHRERR